MACPIIGFKSRALIRGESMNGCRLAGFCFTADEESRLRSITSDPKQNKKRPRIKRVLEIPMTIQVGMVGTDGVLIASDMQRTEKMGLRESSNSSKTVHRHFQPGVP
jgi:hypothetical protein